MTHIKSDTSTPQSDTSRGQSPSDTNSHGDHSSRKEETVAPSSELSKLDESHVDGSKNSMGSVSTLKELVGLNYLFFLLYALSYSLYDQSFFFPSA